MKTFKLTLIRTYQTEIDVEAINETEAEKHLATYMEDGIFHVKELEDPNIVEQLTKVEEVIDSLINL